VGGGGTQRRALGLGVQGVSRAPVEEIRRSAVSHISRRWRTARGKEKIRE